MKKYLLIITIFIAFLSRAHAEDTKINFYIGAGYQVNSLNYDNGTINLSNGPFEFDREDYFRKNFGNVNLFAGYDITEDIALEIGYFSKNNLEKNNNQTGKFWQPGGNPVTTTSKTSLSIINVDAIFNQELFEQFKILTIGGVSRVSYKYDIDLMDNGAVRDSASDKQNGIGFNFGFGGEVKIAKGLSVRATAKYTVVSSIDAFNNFITYGVAAKYSF